MHLLFYVYWILNELVSRPIGARLVITFFLRVYITLAWPFFSHIEWCLFSQIGYYLHAINYSQLFKQYSCKLYVVKI